MNIVFNASAGPSLGIEVELEIVDRGTRQLCSAATEILAELGSGYAGGEHPKVKHELFECTAEVITGICTDVAEARRDLAASIKELAVLTDVRGLALMCSGSHPFSDWHDQRVSPHERYHALVDEMQWVARRLQIFGVHFHVGVRSAAKAIAIANALNTYIPHFLALSASSPFWEGRDTGMASSRSTVFESLPTAGLPYQLSGWAEFEEFMGTLVAAQAITSIREVWWDIRPHPDFGTIELRICDGIPTLTEVSALAAMAQSLVHWLDTRLDAGEELAVPRGWVVRQNKWRAPARPASGCQRAGGRTGAGGRRAGLLRRARPQPGHAGRWRELRAPTTVGRRRGIARRRGRRPGGRVRGRRRSRSGLTAPLARRGALSYSSLRPSPEDG